ncbi:leucine zipper putative tumor suppressor 2-like isoform X1 [Schistocerca gregaria]|uniref:leucine zipper putative tumor suppressor 2-like isoform X1 n=1 Tax=Schistocerca gregaria TaxID=7010 RepID=UPI00211E207E|nr:leucine zipper putative tumor suppressor 2-like isoform X1 [Schistocerca gregaria]XP_049857841.1 leucine zipper putative tumor suppressor 2-like isoform X1 [Schistocerca gregaria]XP_049857842.1 leucine zipper putative tumor suppressor 2-like isoform X1 [Schistocerca gregaria]XP_049857844.1 leucine zipper putative tumor suppressor 2-like isoform X1 [Schistocerca gregaria]
MASAADSGRGTLPSDGGSPPPPPPPNLSAAPAKGKSVVRPVACRPLPLAMGAASRLAGDRYGSTPVLARPGSQLTLYGSSSDLPAGCGNNHSLDRKLLASASTGRPLMGAASLESVRKSPARAAAAAAAAALANSSGGSSLSSSSSHSSASAGSKASSLAGGGAGSVGGGCGCGSLLDLAPSPSDSGVAELEAALRDRDSELAHLRQAMEHNEQVIFRVYQEKERVWERELRRLKSAHENRLRAGAQRAHKLEQTLMTQTYQLQQEKQRLVEEADGSAREAAELRQEVSLLRARLEETEWGLCHKAGELALLKAQLKDAQGEQASKGQEVVQLRTEVRELRAELERRSDQLRQQREEVAPLRAQLDAQAQELARLRAREADLAAQFQSERLTWAQEKEKVLRYQRQLQLNYVQMFRRTKSLEAEVESLTLELELDSKTAAAPKKLPAIEMGHTIEL